MAKTIEEIIKVDSHFEEINEIEIIEIFCGFNDAEEKIIFSGKVSDLPDSLKNLRYTRAKCEGGKLVIKYTDHKSFEGKQIQRQMQTFLQI